jgi:hypothetical protein
VTDERRVERNGRIWTIARVPRAEAEERDFEFWFEGMTPEERVAAVADALLSSLKARGIQEIPKLRKVHRRIRRPGRGRRAKHTGRAIEREKPDDRG